MPAAISLAVIPSRYMTVYLSLVHGVAVLAIVQMALPWWQRLIAVLLLLTVYVVSSRGLAGTRRIEYRSEQWLLWRGDQQLLVGLDAATVWPWLIVLNFRDALTGRRYHCTLWSDSAESDLLRRLRVLLRHSSVYRGDETKCLGSK